MYIPSYSSLRYDKRILSNNTESVLLVNGMPALNNWNIATWTRLVLYSFTTQMQHLVCSEFKNIMQLVPNNINLVWINPNTEELLLPI